jgi:undecaprenyl-diphosphatase
MLYGIVEGITEWLPISSTGHLVLLGGVLDLGMSDSFMEMFNVVIQLGAILAVVVIYFKKLWPFHTKKNGGRRETGSPIRRMREPRAASSASRTGISIWTRCAVAEDHRLGPARHCHRMASGQHGRAVYVQAVPIALMLILYGVLFLLIEDRNRSKKPLSRRSSPASHGRTR